MLKSLVGLFLALAAMLTLSRAAETAPSSPILVELFTSEGCSSCPPADALLQHLDSSQEIPGTQLIVLSEHVDYWNHIGWKDPYSSHFFSDRQSSYADRFGLGSVYTPQMVVDGTTEFVGNSGRSAKQAIEKARDLRKVPVRISAVSVANAGALEAHVEADVLSESSPAKADVYLVVALNHAESQVSGGENQGRRLTHVAVVQSFTKVGSVEQGKNFAQDVRVKLDPKTDRTNLRLIAFVQERGQGKVLGAALERVQQ
jgi:hypothetical protein